MIDVNLLPEQNVIAQKDLKTRSRAVLVIVLATLFTVATLGGLFFYSSYQNSQIGQMEMDKANLDGELTSLTEIASGFLTLKKKASGITTIEKNHYDFADAFSYLSSLVPPGINLNTVGIKDTGEVTLGLSSAEVPVVVSYIGDVTDDPELKEAKVSGLTINDESEVVFTLGSNYGRPKEASPSN